MSLECPLLVWMLFLNREMTVEEYDQCYHTTRTCVPHANVAHAREQLDTSRQMIAHMLPLLMMRHRRVPRSRWKDMVSDNGKHYIEQDIDNAMNPTGRLRAMIGYHLAYDSNLIGMVMTQGRQRDVINVGIGIKQLAVSPPDISVNVYAESFYHKVPHPLEMTFIKPEDGDEVVLRRLCLLLALKQAYIKAIGQPMGFDWARLEFNVPRQTVTGDNVPLLGWEFRVWTSDIGGTRGEVANTKFIWQKERKDIESWVQFINLDQLINVVPKLMD
ncbi:uncharacterized protein B0H18DRAFT_1093944 [Fomitopsis serialis]|uniref:uncharacterized protein n=1 Tax=Fomitopsis serialis TaxID=139415 RepID=UPI002008B20E|nr:uncharacterized protein B0H18DRAFT_1093944 [Neoantrodia serialis]KAH9929409.1 hypothetical protein B0H18DRAFT_1093944 [Neoantrodia serialis]